MPINFCPRCGRPLVMRMVEYRERPVCDRSEEGCGFIYFGHYTLGAGGLVLDTDPASGEGRVVLIQRNEEPNKGGWTIPGGFVEFDETADQAVVREVEEETGLRCAVSGLAAYRNRADPGDNTSYVVFMLEVIEGHLLTPPTPEVAALGFYTIAQMQAIPRLAPLSQVLAVAAIEGRLRRFEPVTVPGLAGRPPFTLFM